jgi:hypothetical protein
MMPVQDNKKVIILVNVYRSFSALTEILKFGSLSETIAGGKLEKRFASLRHVAVITVTFIFRKKSFVI